MSEENKFDFKKCWLALSTDERETFAQEAGTTSHYIQTHLTGRRKVPRKQLLDRIFKACRSRGWATSKQDLVLFFYPR